MSLGKQDEEGMTYPAETRRGLSEEAFHIFGKDLPAAVRANLEEGKSERFLPKGDSLYRAGDSPVGLHFIRQGLIGLVAHGVSGNEYLIRLAKSGQYVGHRSLFARERYYATAIALEEAKIVTISRAVVLNVIEMCPRIALIILESLSKELGHAELGRVSLADKDVTARVAESVLYLRERFPEHNWTRREIAEVCGSTTATVIRTLRRLEDQGVVRQDGRKLQILNREELVSLAGRE